MTKQDTNHFDHTDIPAILCELQGGYLIEASAGTGKTWTLTGILLRLLIEKQYPPERIIATTFTRAAASEMQERLHGRLMAFYQYLQWLMQQRSVCEHWFLVGFGDVVIDDVMSEIVGGAKNAGIDQSDDPINVHLIRHLLTDSDTNAPEKALRRVSLLLATLDKLFVGTLDSFAQKLLREFAGEIGYDTETTISTNEDDMMYSLIHDKLRQAHAHIATNLPKLYQIIGVDIFSDTKTAGKAVQCALQFYTAPIDEFKNGIDTDIINEIHDWFDGFKEIDFSGFEPYYDTDFCIEQGFGGKAILTKNFSLLKSIIEKIKIYHFKFKTQLTKDEKKLIEKFNQTELEKVFKKGFDKQKAIFFSLPVDDLIKIHDYVGVIDDVVLNYQRHLYSNIADDIRDSLKVHLESQKKSTFTFQMVKLKDALSKNPSLCRHIRHLYPIALIDESQDINGLQVDLIKYLYLNPLSDERKNGKKFQGFLLLVGDPKQAIYRFRGGDVVNYNFVKNYGKTDTLPELLNQSLSLTLNRRSNHELIETLNAWFTDDGNANCRNHAYLGDGIYYHQITAVNKQKKLSWQLLEENKLDYLGKNSIAILHFDYMDKSEDNHHLLVAKHINSILQGNHYYTKDETSQSILPSDIAILARRNDELSQMKNALATFGIPAVLPKSQDIFSTKSAKDLYLLLLLVIDGLNHERLVLLMTSGFFGLSIDESLAILNKADKQYIDFIDYLRQCKDILIKFGIASFLNYAFLKNPLKGLPNQNDDLWQQSAKQGERYLADLWQMIEVLGVYGKRHIHEHGLHLLSWYESMMTNKNDADEYKQRLLPSESGVNLLTIHQSKGLEFKIVYIFGLSSESKEADSHFYPYSDEFFCRRISPVPYRDDDDEFFIKKDQQESLDESRRLGYVALTRASEQLFVIAKDLYRKSNIEYRPLFLWFESDDKKLTLPPRLVNQVDFIEINQCKNLIETPYHPDEVSKIHITYQDWHDTFLEKEFYGETKTSATALINQIEKIKTLAQDGENHEVMIDYQSLIYHQTNNHHISYQDDDIRVLFERGTNAGTFLHQVLQFINPNDDIQISNTINQLIQRLNFGLIYLNENQDNSHHQKLLAWISMICHVPMSSGVSLATLFANGHGVMREMPFNMGLGDGFKVDKLNDLFATFDDKRIYPIDDDNKSRYKHLKGEIDLIYEYNHRFYVVDYKSNFISNQLSDYCEQNLNIAMNEAGYWLQACIYQVALHRLLKLRIADYQGNESHYLGGVEFIFLRGIDSNNPKLGRVFWQVPMELIFAMDNILGESL